MIKNVLLVSVAVLPLLGCAQKDGPQVRPIVSNPTAARNAASFCAVSEYQPAVTGDPLETEAQKAQHNAQGAYLCGWK